MKRRFYDRKIETMGRRGMERLQLERLKWQVERCYHGSQFYREKFQRAGITPEAIRSRDDLAKIPIVTKDELRQEQEKHPPFGRYVLAPPSSWREFHPSTGTTGTPVATIWSQRDIENITQWTMRTLWTSGVRPGDIVQNAFSYGLWVAGMSVHYAAQAMGCLVLPLGTAATDRQIDCFLRPGSTVLLSTPSFALHMAERLRERRMPPESISLRMGIFGGEPGAEVPATRHKIESGLGIDAYDYYGLAEIGPTIASECSEKAGLHWCEDHILVEVVDPQTGEPCRPGEVGVLVLTHLTKEATPMLRYWSNDCTRMEPEPCRCGRTTLRTPGILGRADDMIIYRGAKFYPAQVEKVIRSFKELGDEFRIRLSREERTGADRVTVVAECLDVQASTEHLQEVVSRALRDELQVTPGLELVAFGTLERTTFKAKRIEDGR